MIEDLFGNLPYDDYKGSIPKEGINLDRVFDYITTNRLPLVLTGLSIAIGVVL